MLTKISDLKLGDTVHLFEGPFGYGVVNTIKPETVHIFRPYATTAAFEYGSEDSRKVIPYIGFEDCVYEKDSPLKLNVVEQKTLK